MLLQAEAWHPSISSCVTEHDKPARGPQGPVPPLGFTAIELLVAVAVLGILITMVTMILASSKRLVKTSQAKMRANAVATAITDAIRADLRRASKNGFLCITQDGQEGPVRLSLAVPGTTQSLTSAVRGTGECICYGLVDNQATASNDPNDILFRAGWIMSPDEDGAPDVLTNSDFSTLRLFTRPQINGVMASILRNSPLGPLRVPPVKLNEVGRLWQVAAMHCSKLTILWTDGTVNPATKQLNWYGPRLDGSVAAKVFDRVWKLRGIASGEIEFDANPFTVGNRFVGAYRALWTHHNQSNWPKAVKFKFSLRDPDMPADFHNVEYEVICPIGQ